LYEIIVDIVVDFVVVVVVVVVVLFLIRQGLNCSTENNNLNTKIDSESKYP
jgi:cell division protein FtsL